jgi:hypothetical protein
VRRALALLAALSGCATTPAEQPSLARVREGLAGVAARTGDLRLQCDPPDAEVWLDGVPQGVCTDFSGTPAGLRMGEGTHRVEVLKQGFLPYVTYLSPSGARTSLRISLVPRKTPQGATP